MLLHSLIDLVFIIYFFMGCAYVGTGWSASCSVLTFSPYLQVLEADMAILDEIDSGLDVDALQDVAKAVNSLSTPKNSVLMITHYRRLLDFIKPKYVHIMVRDMIKLLDIC